jgi:hypothetical protein
MKRIICLGVVSFSVFFISGCARVPKVGEPFYNERWSASEFALIGEAKEGQVWRARASDDATPHGIMVKDDVVVKVLNSPEFSKYREEAELRERERRRLDAEQKRKAEEARVAETKQAEQEQQRRESDEARTLGEQLAAKSPTKFRLVSSDDALSQSKVAFALHDTASFQAKVACSTDPHLKWLELGITFFDQQVLPPVVVEVDTSYRKPQVRRGLKTRLRRNQRTFSDIMLRQSDAFANVFAFALGEYNQDGNLLTIFGTPKELIYDYAIEIPTNRGAVYLEINPYDPAISSLIATCQSERQGK